MSEIEEIGAGGWKVGGFDPVPPTARDLHKGQTKYPFGELQIGQWALVGRGIRTVRSAVHAYKKRTKDGKVFTMRKVSDVATKVWRVS